MRGGEEGGGEERRGGGGGGGEERRGGGVGGEEGRRGRRGEEGEWSNKVTIMTPGTLKHPSVAPYHLLPLIFIIAKHLVHVYMTSFGWERKNYTDC